MYYEYNGPSIAVRRIAAASAAQGSVLPIVPPALNASWTTQFYGPAIHCHSVSESLRNEILELWSICAS